MDLHVCLLELVEQEHRKRMAEEAHRELAAALAQIDRTLDEASATLRASTSRTLREVIVPLLRPAILATLVFSFTHAMTAVSAIIFLATAK